MEPGCGIQLALKLLVENIPKPLVVTSIDKTHIIRTDSPFLPSDMPCIQAENPASFASNVKTDRMPICFVDEKTTEKHLTAMLSSHAIYTCYNTSGKEKFVKKAGLSKYSATASIAFTEDLKNKLEHAKSAGNAFIEILCPCPKEWGFDSSNTVVVARSSVDSGLWRLYDIKNRRPAMTYRPAKLEPLDIFLNIQKKIRATQEHVNASWKLVNDDKIWETE
ncbi:MAG: hypothetical protein HZB67_05810 [Candidatus Aenigmarchaeota archaeon]|nr:hypothetical protein [Candidatus Aenigmarchaeota archaeon]